ncbi:FecR domain-containing protein [Paraflavitalea sp. CAU 1676]|uniref:FecR domain-containing protein n=1 Tax=Paraflavitalea sp. CAU 1676 TaxID=3032598 RepID=UPI0023DAFD3D|nr:FecR domain-containing protein [Paraflavitalea sp. CAU 1676]MDF2188638.1 DUF4974 domain-containing protein [Paraflavitalea sp. CAU 1676]
MDQQQSIKVELISGYLKGTLTAAQERELNEWLHASAENRNIFDSLTNPETLHVALTRHQEKKYRILRKLDAAALYHEEHKDKWWYPWRRRMRVVAGILVVLISASFILFSHAGFSVAASLPGRFKNDVLPGEEQAKMILDDNAVLILVDTVNGDLARQATGEARILKENGWVFYHSSHCGDTIFKNTMNVPLKGIHRVILPDGSRVWLNAGSSLKYPIMFGRQERRVELSGEAYFEVTTMPLTCHTPSVYEERLASSTAIPFVVSIRNASSPTKITLTGGRLDIKAYPDEEQLETLSLEGSFVLLKDNNHLMIKAGQLARLDSKGQVYVDNNTPLLPRIAWKDGLIKFQDASLQEVLSQLTKWYDIDIEYTHAGKARNRLSGSIDRYAPLSAVLLYLETLCPVRFYMKDRKVIATL